MDPTGTIDSIYKEEYYTLICTKFDRILHGLRHRYLKG